MLYLQPVQILSLHREILTRYNRLLDANIIEQSYKVTIATDVIFKNLSQQLVDLFCSQCYHIVEFFLGPPQCVND